MGIHPPRERGEILRRAFDLIASRTDELAMLMTLEMGKSLVESRAEIAYANDFLRWFSEEAVRIDGRYAVSPNGAARLVTIRQPVGPCLLITPWNFPLAMGTRKIGPAIAAGCTMVVKPAKQTPLSMLALAGDLRGGRAPGRRAERDHDLPRGPRHGPAVRRPAAAQAVVHGFDRGRPPLAARAMDRVLRVSMELGGNAPFIVFADADLDAAVEGAMVAKLRNVGEACTAANRFYVAAPRRRRVRAAARARMNGLRVGRGIEPDTRPRPADRRRRSARRCTSSSSTRSSRGARVLTGGEPLDGPGYFYPPTVLGGVTAGSRLLKDEIFGPVAPVVAFDTEEEAIAAANDTEFGLVAYLYTRDLDRALRVAEALETGMVGLNQGIVSNPAAPFGGVKQSGFGREGGHEGIGEYLATKYVALPLLS